MSMSKKDFEAIAKVISAYRTNVVSESIARDLVLHLATTNPKFNRARFLAACGVEE